MRAVGILFAAVLLVACTDDPPSTTGGGGSEGGAGATGAAGGQGGAGASAGAGGTGGYACNPPLIPEEEITESVGTVSGTVHDLAGNPAVGVLSDVCGTNICLAANTDASGDFVVMGMPSDVVDARLVYGDGLTHAKMAGRVPSFPNADVGTIHTPLLPPFSQGAPIVAGEDATSNGVTLHVAADAQIDHDILLYGEDERGLRVALFTPADGNFPAIEASLNLELVIGLAPSHSLICPGVGLTFPNQPDWAPGAAVEVLYNNVEIYPSYAPYGGWEVVAEATVSADGATVTTNDGEAIAEIGTFGARLKQ